MSIPSKESLVWIKQAIQEHDVKRNKTATAMSSSEAEYWRYLQVVLNHSNHMQPRAAFKEDKAHPYSVSLHKGTGIKQRMSMLVKVIRSQDGIDDKDNDKGSKSRSQSMKEQAYNKEQRERPRPHELNDKSNLIDLMKECHQ
ncbi:hypothetical protein Tco_0925762 [Tanacetum coccineum]|uniref:Uncharacterized protein n=1 Tax=Tanacetum coccineum TaxID=301880 RepID=A0ABQ5D9T1_9ASTR